MMQMGYNSDIRHKGVIVHIQTEDHGVNSAKITTQVFHSGAVLDSRTISYEELVEAHSDEEKLSQEIVRRMKALHKYFHNQIGRDVYDHRLPIEAELVETPEPAAPAPVAASEGEAAPDARQPDGLFGTKPCFLGVDVDLGSMVGPAFLRALAS